MAKKDMEISQWVDERLAVLDGGDWEPDAERGRSRLRDRARTARRRRIEWILASVAGAAACVLLLVFFSPGACARPRGCPGYILHSVGPAIPRAAAPPRQPVAETPQAVPARMPAAAKPARPVSATPAPAATVANFKESGLPTAPIVCEVYTDYECPSCALFYKDTVPLLLEQYVRTGKVKLVHRDFPLLQHRYARLAARYANAAGTIGRYDLVVNQVFQTQNVWSHDGNVDAQVAEVLAPGDMQKVRDLVAHDPHLDDTVETDRNMGASDHIAYTPSVVVVFAGRRQTLAGVPQFPMLQTYLNQLLSAR